MHRWIIPQWLGLSVTWFAGNGDWWRTVESDFNHLAFRHANDRLTIVDGSQQYPTTWDYSWTGPLNPAGFSLARASMLWGYLRGSMVSAPELCWRWHPWGSPILEGPMAMVDGQTSMTWIAAWSLLQSPWAPDNMASMDIRQRTSCWSKHGRNMVETQSSSSRDQIIRFILLRLYKHVCWGHLWQNFTIFSNQETCLAGKNRFTITDQ